MQEDTNLIQKNIEPIIGGKEIKPTIKKKIKRNTNYWKQISYYLLALLGGIFLSFLSFQVYNSGKQEFSVIKVQILQDSIVSSKIVKAKMDSIATLKVQNDIQLVEKKNDGRFEVLTWSASLLITLLAIFITFNFIVSSSKVKELVDEEMDKRNKEMVQANNKLQKKYKLEIEKIEELSKKAKKAFEEIIAYTETMNVLNTDKDE